jgi:hypothetical protein
MLHIDALDILYMVAVSIVWGVTNPLIKIAADENEKNKPGVF